MSYLVECNYERHGAAIQEIFNEVIANSTALYDYQPRDSEDIKAWFEDKALGHFPIVGLEDENSDLMGFASFGKFRPQTAYMHSVEHSVYVHNKYRKKGIGKRLLSEIIQRAKQQDFHLMIGLIDSANTTSIHLHKSFGFTCSGTIKEAGYKFERWLDVDIYQLKLEPKTRRSLKA